MVRSQAKDWSSLDQVASRFFLFKYRSNIRSILYIRSNIGQILGGGVPDFWGSGGFRGFCVRCFSGGWGFPLEMSGTRPV